MAFLGMDGFAWSIGVVEDRMDPEQLQRVRVRWLGLHTENKEDILTKDLPWAQVMQPATATSMGGIGHNSAIVEGTWVCGFAKDPGTLQEWVVMGTLPGENITTAHRGGPTLGRAWSQARGDYKEFMESVSTEIPESSTKYKDYDKGFYDPTVDQRNIPHPPSTMSYGNLGAFTPSSKPPIVDNADTTAGIPRVMNWNLEGSPEVQDLDAEDIALTPTPYPVKDLSPGSMTRATHSDMLHYLFKTTRRLTADARWTKWSDFGTFKWPDTNTYTEDGVDIEPEKDESKTSERKRLSGNETAGQTGTIISTGFLEPGIWSQDREYAFKGGTYGPAFPITRDTPAVSTDPSGLTGISPLDTRAGWGSASGAETGYWAQNGEWYRVPHPRVSWVKKGHLSPTEREEVKKLFDTGQYGTGDYNISDPEEGRQDIKWKDVKDGDLVVVPTPDTSPLALGGIPIASISGATVTTVGSLWGDSTTYFANSDTSMGEPAKPKLQAGDIVQIAGVRGMQEINGRIFRLLSCSDGGSSFSMKLGTVDGAVWAGPAGISWLPGTEKWGSSGKEIATSSFSEYLGGGVVIPHRPHWALCWKADMRERQINIGSPNPETGEEYRFWNQPAGDFNARYPFNHVYETESGHIMEYDDTPGHERISQFHRSGTNYEIDSSGTKTEYVKGDNYDIRLHDDYVYVKGKVAHTFDDAVMIRYNDRADISAKWKLQLWSGGDLDIHSKRNINMKSDGDINLQADGHINLHGTGITPDQTELYRAGTRNAKERSKIKMKAGHIEMEAVGNESLPKEYGIYAQSDQAPIAIKTLTSGTDGHQGNIHIASAYNLELFAWANQYRTAYGREQDPIEDVEFGNIYDYAWNGIKTELEIGDMNTTIIAGSHYETTQKDIDIKSCTESIRLQAVDKDISLKAGDDMLLEAIDEMHIKSGDEMYIEAVDWIDMLAGTYFAAKAGTTLNLTAVGNLLEKGAEIHMNGPTPQLPSAADSALNATTAGISVMAWVPKTMELLSTDLLNPNPASGYAVTSLALNANDKALGIGGENIRNLHDTIPDMQSGVSAYVTKTYPATSGTKSYEADQNAYVATGETTYKMEDPWNGYKQQVEKQEPLGKVDTTTERFTSAELGTCE